MFSPRKFNSELCSFQDNLYQDQRFTRRYSAYWEEQSPSQYIRLGVDKGAMGCMAPSNIQGSRDLGRDYYVFLEESAGRMFDYPYTVYDDLPGTWVRIFFEDRLYKLLNVSDERYQFEPPTPVPPRQPRTSARILSDYGRLDSARPLSVGTASNASIQSLFNRTVTDGDYFVNTYSARVPSELPSEEISASRQVNQWWAQNASRLAAPGNPYDVATVEESE